MGYVVDRICFDIVQVCVDVCVCGKVWMYVYINIWYMYMCICIYVGMCIFGPDVMYLCMNFGVERGGKWGDLEDKERFLRKI